MILYDTIRDIRDRLKSEAAALDEVLAALEDRPQEQTMSLDQFQEHIGDTDRALVLAKKCNIGHSVFYDILKGERRTMRGATKSRIASVLGITITQ